LEVKQKIHDALLKELVKTDDKGKYPILMNLVRRGGFTVKCSVDLKSGKGCVDVVLTYPREAVAVIDTGEAILMGSGGGPNPVTFELITDVDFDVGKKLAQVNRYKREYTDVRVIIPEEYREDYSQLFTINDVRVHTWKGIRKWKCKKCGNITEIKDSSMKPDKCSSGSCSNNQLYFVGLKDAQFR
jgi:hypothetical protein